MRHLAFVSIAFLGLWGSQALGGAFICNLPSGVDNFTDSEGSGTILVPGFPTPLPFVACGPASVVRGAPDNSAGPCTIPTEIVAMTLSGVLDPCGVNLPIMFTEDPAVPSAGSITSDATGGLPATSCFEVHTLVTVGAMLPFPHTSPAVCALPLNHVPPGSATPGGSPCLRPGEDPYTQGFPDKHDHDPCPRKLCCEVFCPSTMQTVKLHLSCRACQELFGQHVRSCGEGDCPILCATQGVAPSSWGQVKTIYRD